MSSPRAITIAILAMGGEGGGVLADWLVDLAEANGYLAQTTSVPGVAQRTGATIYYLEMFPEAAVPAGEAPVLGLSPVPGEVDIVIASELMEAGRAVQRGLVTADRTTFIASSHRVYSMTERTAMGDDRVDSNKLIEGGRAAARRFVTADFATLAERTGSPISPALYGALAATGALPFTREQFEDTIRRGGVGVTPSLKAFGAGFDAAVIDAAATADIAAVVANSNVGVGNDAVGNDVGRNDTAVNDATGEQAHGSEPVGNDVVINQARRKVPGDTPAANNPAASSDAAADRQTPRLAEAMPPDTLRVGARLTALSDRIRRDFPADVHKTLHAGIVRCADYQDVPYAVAYLDRLAALQSAIPNTLSPAQVGAPLHAHAGAPSPTQTGGSPHTLLNEAARHLALWMTYEDTVRVADLKTRRSRFARVSGEVRLSPKQQLDINEFLHPRLEEIADTLPAGLGRWLLRSRAARACVEPFLKQGRVVQTTSIRGFLLLYTIASLRGMRPKSLRFQVEHQRIDDWLATVTSLLPDHPDLAEQVVRAQRLVKGYGDTHHRGWNSYQRVTAMLPALRTLPDGAAQMQALIAAALADDSGRTLASAIDALAGAPVPHPTQAFAH
jgi:indolepyruvate ferredoxin oxidoreductase beta subunit